MIALLRFFYLALVIIVSALFLIHCSDGGTGTDDDNKNPIPEPEPENTVGPSGGTVESDDGRVTLEFPAGALTEGQPVTITAIEREDLGSEFDAVIEEFGFGRAYDMQPDGLSFEEPVIVTYRSEQAVTQENDSVNVALEYLFVNEEEQAGALENLTLNVHEDTGDVAVGGELNHFSELVVTDYTSRVSYLTTGIPSYLTVERVIFAVARVRSYDQAAAGFGFLKNAVYVDRSEGAFQRLFEPAEQELDNGIFGSIQEFPYTCAESGTGLYNSFVKGFIEKERSDSDLIIYEINGLSVQRTVTCIESPTLESPANRSTVTGPETQLNWQTVEFAESYIVQVVEEGNSFDDPEAEEVRVDEATNAELSGLKNNTTYEWRVRAVVGNYQTEWSEIWKFTTDFGTETLELGDLKVCLEHGESSSDLLWNWAIVASFFDNESDIVVKMTVTLPDESIAEITTSPISAQLLFFVLEIYAYGNYEYEITEVTYKGEPINIGGENLTGTIEVTADEQNAGECGGG